MTKKNVKFPYPTESKLNSFHFNSCYLCTAAPSICYDSFEGGRAKNKTKQKVKKDVTHFISILILFPFSFYFHSALAITLMFFL